MQAAEPAAPRVRWGSSGRCCFAVVCKQPAGKTLYLLLHLVICLSVLGQCQNSWVLKAEGKQIHLSWFCPRSVNASCLRCNARLLLCAAGCSCCSKPPLRVVSEEVFHHVQLHLGRARLPSQEGPGPCSCLLVLAIL